MIKINLRQKLALLLSTLVTTSGVSASNSENLNRVNTEKSSFSTGSGNKSSFLIEKAKLVKKSCDEKCLAGGIGLVAIATLLIGILGISGKKNKTSEETSGKGASKGDSGDESKTGKGPFQANIPERTVVFSRNSLNISESNIKEVVKNITTSGTKLKLVEKSDSSLLKEFEDEHYDSFYIFENYNETGVGLIVRLLNKNDPCYSGRREFYADNLENFNDDARCQTIYGIYENAVIMEVCNRYDCVGNGRIGCGKMTDISSSKEKQFLLDQSKYVYYEYEHHNQESDDIKQHLPK
ncbi:MAG: hypothetical protein FWC41_05965 [Firmicutes bacterium]|nr:hypothetical protein [Bacillota bacterium]